jgi:hypothetical protein
MTLTFQEKMELAKVYASSTLVPAIYRDNSSNCFIAIEIAKRQFDMDPMQIMQNMYPMEIKKKNAASDFKFCITTSLAISFAIQSGFLSPGTTIIYSEKGVGDTLSVTASMLLKNQETISYTVSMATAKKSGWSEKRKQDGGFFVPEQWKNFPELMLRYRAATLLIRTHIPQVLLGCHTKEEIEDIKDIKDIESTNLIEERVVISKPKISEDLKITEDLKTIEEKQVVCSKLQSIIKDYNISDKTIEKWCEKASVAALSQLTDRQIDKIYNYYTNRTLDTIQIDQAS